MPARSARRAFWDKVTEDHPACIVDGSSRERRSGYRPRGRNPGRGPVSPDPRAWRDRPPRPSGPRSRSPIGSAPASTSLGREGEATMAPPVGRRGHLHARRDQEPRRPGRRLGSRPAREPSRGFSADTPWTRPGLRARRPKRPILRHRRRRRDEERPGVRRPVHRDQGGWRTSRRSGSSARWPRGSSSTRRRSRTRRAPRWRPGKRLMDRMKAARYGVLFYGMRTRQPRGGGHDRRPRGPLP